MFVKLIGNGAGEETTKHKRCSISLTGPILSFWRETLVFICRHSVIQFIGVHVYRHSVIMHS